jgi:hypothetical protein
MLRRYFGSMLQIKGLLEANQRIGGRGYADAAGLCELYRAKWALMQLKNGD